MSSVAILLTAAVLAAPPGASSQAEARVHADPQHPWNRAHAALCAREGPDEPDGAALGLDSPFPLLWGSSTYLLEDERFAEASAALSELVATADETAGMDVRARVLLQSDLWAVFDWAAADVEASPTARERRRALAVGAARAMRALAPMASEIAALADPLAAACASGELPPHPTPGDPRAPFLPPDLFAAGEPDSPWVLLSEEPARQQASQDTPLAIAHAETFQGRTSFAVYLRVPSEVGGRVAASAYLAALGEHAALLACDGDCFGGTARHGHLDPLAPAPPEGTMVALVQRLLAFDEHGDLFATPIPLVVQLRAYLPVPDDAPKVGAPPPYPDAWPYQAFAELRLDRRRFLAGAGGLVALGPEDRAFDLFAAHGDEVELFAATGPRVPLASCTACHGVPGALSLNAFTRTASGSGTHLDIPLFQPPRVLVAQSADEHAARAARFKARRFEWGMLRGIWATGD